MTNFWKAVAQLEQTETKEISYRLYYNQDGSVKCYSMEELDGDYIVIDKDTYNQFRTDIVVKNNKIIRLTNNASWKLCPSTIETYGCYPSNVSIVVENDYPQPQYWSVKTTHDAD